MSDAADNVLDSLKDQTEFGPHTEKAIISLAFEQPDFFETINHYIDAEYFHDKKCKFVYLLLDKLYKEYRVIPSRWIIRDKAIETLTVDDDYQPVLDLIEYNIEPRDIPIIKGELMSWARDKAYGMIYSDEALSAYELREYDKLEKIIEEAGKVTDFGSIGFSFFDQFEDLFHVEDIIHFTTGFESLDRLLNNGGPSTKEVLCYMAPTGVGKSMAMVNTGVANILREKNVLHVTLEMSAKAVAKRYAGCFTNLAMSKLEREEEQDKFKDKINKIKANIDSKLIIQEYGPNEASVSDIYALLENLLQKKSFVPDVIIIDYLDLLQSKMRNVNQEKDYVKQKQVSVEVRGLAFKEDCFVVTATQSNRTGSDPKEQARELDLNSMAESYGKSMTMDYVISIQQTKGENKQEIPEVRLYIAKNRNGPKFNTIRASVNYSSSKMLEKKDAAA